MFKRTPYVGSICDLPLQGRDRRQACRYKAASEAAALGWWDGEEYRTVPALLKNLSLNGALTLVETLPPADVPIWICLGGATPSEWVEATVIEESRERRGKYQVRIQFKGSCPYEFFDSAIRATAIKPGVGHHVSTEFDGRYWR